MFTETHKPKIKGIVHLDIYRNGVLHSTEEHNTIVDTSSSILARLIGFQGTYSDKAITLLKVSDGDLPTLKTKTDLDGTKFEKLFSAMDVDGDIYEYDVGTPYEIKFNFNLDELEFNGNDIWQFGLFSGDGQMFSMLSRNPSKSYPIEKDTDVLVIGWWKIIFVNA
jgi:hypothetical protein